MQCPVCHAERPDGSSGPCPTCTAALADAVTLPPVRRADADAAPTIGTTGTIGTVDAAVTCAPPTSRPATSPAMPSPESPPTGSRQPAAAGPLQPGSEFGSRYHVIRLLGAGGMGAVYQAWDDTLGVAVALKVIRPQPGEDPAASQEIERRFKRELLLARQVTHKNVVRIHDLGEIDGITYITMPYIQGTDLAKLLKRDGRVPVRMTLDIARQVARGLAAAHDAGVVHRDLKPANIMLDEAGQAVIMDFGIASPAGSGMTSASGTVVGTLEYMAPEQALGQVVDQRADIYAFGLILYDLLLGRRPQASDSAVAELMARLQAPPAPPRSIDPTIPEAVDAVIVHCLQNDPVARFQSTHDVIAALDALDAEGQIAAPGSTGSSARRTAFTVPMPAAVAAAGASPATRRRPGRAAIAGGAVIVVMALAGVATYVVRRPPSSTASTTAVAGAGTAVAVIPFHNATGDASLDWMGPAIADILKSKVAEGGARIVPSDRLYQLARDLHLDTTGEIEPAAIKRLAEFSSSNVVISGSYTRTNGQLQLAGSVRSVADGTVHQVDAAAADASRFVDAAGMLARAVDTALSSTGSLARPSQAFRPSTTSVDALRLFTEGEELSRRGNHLQAVSKYEASTRSDPQFAFAYARLAQAYARTGHDADAERVSGEAMNRAASLPERERYAITAVRASVLNDQAKAIDAYENLLRLVPNDLETLYNLGSRYEASGDFDKARANYAKVIAADPKYFDALFAAGRVEVLRKNPEGALDSLNRALSVAIQLDNDEARGSALNAIGIAYKRLNRWTDAQRYYTEALEIRTRVGDKRGMAATSSELGQVQKALGHHAESLASYRRALDIRREIGDKRGIANTLNDIGSLYVITARYDDAVAQFKEALQLQKELGNADYQALALQNIGQVYVLQAKYDDASGYLQQALQLREKQNVPAATAETLLGLGDIDARLGRSDEATGRYLKALELSRSAGDRRGAARASGAMAALFADQGRYKAAIDARADALKELRAVKETGDVLVDALSGSAVALTLAGRHDEAQPLLDEAAAAARRVPGELSAAVALHAAGEDAFLTGHAADAVRLLTQAQQKKFSDPYLALKIKTDLARAHLAAGHARDAATLGASAAAGATRLGLRYLATDASMTVAEAAIAQKAEAPARRALDAALRDAERIGSAPLLLRGHEAAATLERLAGRAGQIDVHVREAARLRAEIQN